MTTQPTAPVLNIPVILALTLVHFAGDFFSSFTGPLLPVYVETLSLSMVQVGLLTGAMRLLAFVIQPCVGYLADRYQTRAFIFVGLLLTAVCIPFSGIAPNYPVLFIILAAGSVGSSMFHPSVAGMVPLYSGPRKGLCISVFNTGGTLAFAIGPVFIAWYVSRFGLAAMPWTMVLGLIPFFLCMRAIPMPVTEGLQHLGFLNSIKESLGDVWKTIALIWIVMVIRAIVGQSFMTFMPVHLAGMGMSLIPVGTIVALFVVAGTASGLLAGFFSDRIGFKPIFMVAHLLMTPALLLYLYLPGSWVYAGAFISGFFVLSTIPLGVVMAQTLAPKGRSMVSSLMMGLAYGLGGAFSPLVGKFADIYTIEQVLLVIAFLPLITLVFIARFPDMGNSR